ncbi:uncharacterized protein LOC125084901 [Lutra lutra]|uniref:uncharacterized protein LOC125084901 n=1 Tax=Lutra lutra TaxID=9657 RepID=UPI001FD2CE5D|nr:uncharacterized protein LOC125084901 [Lutra lutra]
MESHAACQPAGSVTVCGGGVQGLERPSDLGGFVLHDPTGKRMERGTHGALSRPPGKLIHGDSQRHHDSGRVGGRRGLCREGGRRGAVRAWRWAGLSGRMPGQGPARARRRSVMAGGPRTAQTPATDPEGGFSLAPRAAPGAHQESGEKGKEEQDGSELGQKMQIQHVGSSRAASCGECAGWWGPEVQLVPPDRMGGQSVDKCHEALVSFPTPGPHVPPVPPTTHGQERAVTAYGDLSCDPGEHLGAGQGVLCSCALSVLLSVKLMNRGGQSSGARAEPCP